MRRVALALLCAVACACGGEESVTDASDATEEDTTDTVIVSASVSPDVAVAGAATTDGFEWSTTFTLTLTETTGTGATVTNLSADLRQAAGGIVIAPPGDLDESFRFDVRAATNRLEGMGTLSVELEFEYSLPNGGREALVSLIVDLVDDNGFVNRLGVDVRVQ